MSTETQPGGSSRVFLPVLIVLYAVAALAILRACMLETRGMWVYPMDDQYITMSIARNFALHGVWGATRFAFSSSTSTPLYTLLLSAFFRIFGVVDWLPLLVSLSAGAVALVAAWRLLDACLPTLRAGALAAVCFLSALPVLGLLGMEHTLHIALVLLFVDRTLHLWDDPGATLDWKFALLAILMTATRYESLFLIAAAAAAVAWRRRFATAGALILCGAFPVLAYGLVSMMHGWGLIPASVAIKGAHMEASWKAVVAVFFRLLSNILLERPLSGFILVLVVAAAYRWRRLPARVRLACWLTLAAWLAHMATAQVGSTYRYEAYLIALTTATMALVANEYRDARTAEQFVVAVVVLLSIVPLSLRFASAASNLPRASHAVWAQQYQMAQFLRRYYNGAGVAAHDIGAINYFADIDCVDVAGLGNNAIFRVWYAQQPVLPVIEQESRAHHVRIAVLYPEWFPQVPAGWIRAGGWKLADRANLGSDVVFFYAVGEEEAPRLKQALVEFAATMPRDEQVFIY